MPEPAPPAAPDPVDVLVVQHADDCPPALLGDWLERAGCRLDVRRPYAGEALPASLEDHDGLLVLGGPMGACDDGENPWLEPVRELVRDAVATRVPVLGICLGHQLAAVALGGRVARNPRGQQLGVLEVGWTAEAASDELLAPLTGPAAGPARGVQWNNDVVTGLPPAAVVLARTPYDELQAVRLAPRCWGLQLHPEVDEAVLRPWAEDDRGSHEALGIDQDALLRGVRDARAELDATWRPLADSFAAVLRRVGVR